jgi:hypothetical protein
MQRKTLGTSKPGIFIDNRFVFKRQRQIKGTQVETDSDSKKNSVETKNHTARELFSATKRHERVVQHIKAAARTRGVIKHEPPERYHQQGETTRAER